MSEPDDPVPQSGSDGKGAAAAGTDTTPTIAAKTNTRSLDNTVLVDGRDTGFSIPRSRTLRRSFVTPTKATIRNAPA